VAIRDLITAVAASPAARQVATSGAAALADGLWRWWQARRAPEDPMLTLYRQHLEKLDRLIEQMPAPPPRRAAEPAGSAPPLPAGPATVIGEALVTAAPAGTSSDIGSACVPCTRAHLLGVRGDLREALRFARESGIDHPEARRRVDHAAEEVVMLERYDLTPEAIAKAPPEEQAVIRDLLPELRRLRQRLVNEVNDVEDLELAAIEASNLYERLQARTRRKPAPAPDGPVEQALVPPPAETDGAPPLDGGQLRVLKECTPCKLAAAVGSARAALHQHGLSDEDLADVEDRCEMDAACIRTALESARERLSNHPEAHEALGVILDETFGQQVRPAA